MNHWQRAVGVALLAALSCAAGLWAQSTGGGIVGRVADEEGGGLPGVTVEAKSPALQGVRTTTTAADGSYHISLLPPGEYTITFTLEGFATDTKNGVAVDLGRDTTLNTAMRAAAAEEITVFGEAPVVDTTTAALGVNISTRAIETLPSGRNYTSVVQIAPGISSDANPENSGQATITVYGSSGAENSYYVDGVNTTGVEYGFQGKELNFEFIQAIDVKTGGYEAEFGRSTGGVINVITKSGGNEFHGDVFGYWDDDSLQSSPDTIVSTGGTVEGYTKKDYGFDLGGYMVKDKLWFFGAYDKVDNTVNNSVLLTAGPQAGSTLFTDSTSDRDLAAIKLTWNATSGQSVQATFFQDPREDGGAISDGDHTLNGEPLTYLGTRDFGGKDYGLRYEAIIGGGNWVVSAQISRHEEENSVAPETAAGDVVEFRDSALDGYQTGGFGLIQGKDFSRDAYGGSVEHYVARHDLKLGLEWEQEEATVIKRMSGGQRVDILRGDVTGLPVYSHFYWTTPDATVADAPTSQLDATPKHDNTTAYLQDRWQVSPSFTLNFGLRWDRQEIFDRFGEKVIDLKEDYAPRLGFVWDPTHDGRSKVYASYGAYYEQIPMDLVIRSFAQERQARIFNYSPTSTAPDPAAEADIGREAGEGGSILGGFTEPADPNLKNQYLNEFIAGYEREVLPDIAVGVKGVYREYARVIEDFLCIDDGTYCIGNPGEGIMKRIFTYDYSTTHPAPDAERKYRGVQLDVTKRFSNNWSGLVSYIYSKLDGNYDGEYAPFTNVGADPNISAMYDYYDFFTDGCPDGSCNGERITNDGPLSNDRRHQFKFSGVYLTPIKLSVGVSGYYRSGTPVTRYGFFDGYGRYELFLTKRGAEGRTPSNYEMDVHLGYPLDVGPAQINFLLDIFNLLNTQRAVLLDQRWGFQETDNAESSPVNPGYKRPVLRTGPTAVRLGIRISM
jgi:outer membrane receptor for ferrienterochelin and colicin